MTGSQPERILDPAAERSVLFSKADFEIYGVDDDETELQN